MRRGAADIADLLERHPENLRSSAALFAAVCRDRADVVTLLLDLGLPIDVQHALHQHAMPEAASNDAVHVAEVLASRGAAIDPRQDRWGATPYGFAVYGKHQRTIDFLGRHSRRRRIQAAIRRSCACPTTRSPPARSSSCS